MIDQFSFQNLSFSFEGVYPILTKSTFVFPANQNVLLDGATGEGKSTILKLLAALILPQEGQVKINDLDITDMSFEEFLPLRKRMGYTFDYAGLMANRTLWDNLILPLLYHNEITIDEAEARVSDLMSRFGILNKKDQRPAAVSGGMRKACVVLRAFVMNPEAVFLDDPFVGLSRENCTQLVRLINEHRERHGLKHVFLTTSDEAPLASLTYARVRIENQNLLTQNISSLNSDQNLTHFAKVENL